MILAGTHAHEKLTVNEMNASTPPPLPPRSFTPQPFTPWPQPPSSTATSVPGTRVFIRNTASGLSAALYFWGGVGLLMLAGIGLFAAIRTRAGAFQLQLMANVPTLLAVGCFIVAWRTRRAPREVVLTENEITIRGRTSTETTVPLAELTMATVHSEPFTQRRRLNLFDRAGRRAAVVPDAIQPFDELVDILQQTVARHADDHTAAVRLRKSRRQAVMLVLAALFFGGLGTTLFITDRIEANDARLLADQGQPATAKMLRHFTAPNGTTRRIEYRVTDAASGKTADHNVEVDPEIWPLLSNATEVPVIAVPGRPDVAKLEFGEVKDDMGMSPKAKVLLYIAVGVMCLVFIVAAVLNWRGIDIDLDSKTGKFSIKRFGEGR